MMIADGILERANVRSIAEFLLYGCGSFELNKEDCESKLRSAWEHCDCTLEKYDLDKESELYQTVDGYVNETMNVYLEIGIKAGMLLYMDTQGKLTSSKNTNMYQKMYDTLINESLLALKILEGNNEDACDKAIAIIKAAHLKTEQIFVESENINL